MNSARRVPAKITSSSIALFWAVTLLCAAIAQAAAPPTIGSSAPDFSLPLAANGSGQVSLSRLKGHAIYLNFFASWCLPCKAEAPSIGKLALHFAKHNVVVIGIDELEARDKANQFAMQYKLPY